MNKKPLRLLLGLATWGALLAGAGTVHAAPLAPTLNMKSGGGEEPFLRDFRKRMLSLNEADLQRYRKELAVRVDAARKAQQAADTAHYESMLRVVNDVQRGR